MKANRFFAILVLVASAIWVLTGTFSSVGSATAQSTEPSKAPQQEMQNDAANATESASQSLQSVGVAMIPAVQHARSVRISGVTQADKTTQITARETGIVMQLSVEKGQQVNEGDLVLMLDPEGRDAALRSARQLVDQRRAEAEARQKLVERGTLPKLQLDETMSALRGAESALEAKIAELARLEVTAPFSGIIDRLDVEIGGAVQPGTPVATLIALDPIIGKGEVNEADLPIVKLGAAASMRLVDGSIVEGTIRYISRQSDPVTRTYGVEIEAANRDAAIPSGMTIELILRGQPVLATPVPRSIVTLSDAGELGVRSVDSDNKVVFHGIDIVDDSPGALLLAGIPEGARIIVVGQNFVADGQTVEAIAADPAALEKLIDEARQGQAVQ